MTLKELEDATFEYDAEADCTFTDYESAIGTIEINIAELLDNNFDEICKIGDKVQGENESYKDFYRRVLEYTFDYCDELLGKLYNNDDEIIEDFYGLDRFFEDFGYTYTREEYEADEADYIIDDRHFE